MATKVDLRERAAKKLGILTEARALSAYEAQTIDDVIEEEHAVLEADGLAYWSLSDIPEGAMRGLRDIVAGRAAPNLKDAQNAQPYTSLVEIGKRSLREFTYKRGTERSTVHRYF